jgi:DNA-binding XRE family transcriptional regulator
MTRAKLKAFREAWGWTQEEAGLWYGLPVSSAGRTWRRWENGERSIPGPLAKRVGEKGLPDARV